LEKSPDYSLIIEPNGSANILLYCKELWLYRELFLLLSWRDILIRYKQTTIGLAWSILRPLLTMVVFTLVFGKIARLPSKGIAYPILVFTAMLPWQLFSNSLSESSGSLVNNANLLSKVYFPRLIVPASSIIVSLVDFILSFAVLIVLLFWYHIIPRWQFLTLPLFICLALIASFGAGLWFSALYVKYRDFRYLVPFVSQLGLYISPVGFSSNVVPKEWQLLYSINPMVGVIEGFRWAILGETTQINWLGFSVSSLSAVMTLWGGFRYFKKTEKAIADII
jgi:lipopolysaccharide transport system permease protein